MPNLQENVRSFVVLCSMAATAAVLPGCVALSESMTTISASQTEAYAVVQGRVLHGKARLTSERGGSFQLQSSESPPLACFGPLSYTSTVQGVINLSCSNGGKVAVSFQAFSPSSGAGRGAMERAQSDSDITSAVDFNLTYGLKPDKAASYLAVPLASLLPLAVDSGATSPAQLPASP